MNDLIAAIERFKLEPEKLTRADIVLITKADPPLGERARAAKAKADAEALAGVVVQAVKAAIAPMQAKHDALAARVLELEAQAAARAEVRP
jgi:hypothetical protein